MNPERENTLANGFGVHASRSVASALISELPGFADFVIVDGGKQGVTDTALNHVFGRKFVVIDRFGPPSTFATPEAPFDLDVDGLFPQTLDEIAPLTEATGSIRLVPAGFLDAGARMSLKAIYSLCRDLEGRNAVLRLPVHTQWMAGKDLELLIAVLNQIPIPVALFPGGSPRDPLDTVAALKGLVAITRACRHVQVWGTDLAGLGTYSFGAPGFAFGMGSGQRHTLAPGQAGRRNRNTDRRPSRIVQELHRWRSAANLDESDRLYTCEECCNGEPLKALTDNEARMHNLATARRLFGTISAVDAPLRVSAYHEILDRARSAHDRDDQIKLDTQIKAWLRILEAPESEEFFDVG